MSFSLPLLSSIIKFQYSLDCFSDSSFPFPISLLTPVIFSRFSSSLFLYFSFWNFHCFILVFPSLLFPYPFHLSPSFCFQVFRFHAECLTLFRCLSPLSKALSSRWESEPVNKSSVFRLLALPVCRQFPLLPT